MTKQPAAPFNAELVAAPVKGAIAAVDGGRVEMWMVPWKSLKTIEGFNVRADSPDNKAHIADLAQSMVANGFFKDKPLAGYAAKDGKKEVVYITDGHCRLQAVALAVESGAEIDRIPVVLTPSGTSMADLMVRLVQSNSGKPLAPLELAEVVKRLAGYGVDNKDIATRLGKTPKYCRDLLELAGAPTKIRQMVAAGKVSATEALKQLRAKGEEAAEALTQAEAKAAASGKTKVTGKTIDGPKKERKPREKKGADLFPITTYFDFRMGQRLDMDAIKPFRDLAGGDWWRLNEEVGKADIIANFKGSITYTKDPCDPNEAADPTEGL